MAIDNRDWYRNWLRERSGYVERASFRLGEGDLKRQRHRAAWRRNWIALGVVVALMVALFVFR